MRTFCSASIEDDRGARHEAAKEQGSQVGEGAVGGKSSRTRRGKRRRRCAYLIPIFSMDRFQLFLFLLLLVLNRFYLSIQAYG